MAKKKANIARELLETERLYTANLRILYFTFLEPLCTDPRAVKILSKETELNSSLQQLSATITIISSYHLILLAQLEEHVGQWNNQSRLGRIFAEMSSYLKSYTQYVSFYQPLVRHLQANRKNQQLSNLLASLMTDECRGKGIRDFLIMPVQRIPRYKMMLLDLLDKTWVEHCDFEDLSKASGSISEICGLVEFMSDKAIRLERKMEVAQSVVLPRKWDFTLTAPHRNFLWEDSAQVSIVLKPFGLRNDLPTARVFAFSDLLLICEERNEKLKAIDFLHFDEVSAKQRITFNGDEIFIIFSARSEVKIIPQLTSSKGLLDRFSSTFSAHDQQEASDDAVDAGSPNTDRRTVRIRRLKSAGSPADGEIDPALERASSARGAIARNLPKWSPHTKRHLLRRSGEGSTSPGLLRHANSLMDLRGDTTKS